MSDFIVSILESFLGENRGHNHGTGQVRFDCPSCEELGLNSEGKGNLEVNYNEGLFNCWACGQQSGMHGYIPKLIKKYGTPALLKEYLLLKPDQEYKKDTVEDVKVFLPETFKPFIGTNPQYDKYQEAIQYLKSRKISMEVIEKYNIGFTTGGKYANRIIIPSYDENLDINYFVGRAFQKWTKPKYLNPDAEKENIIFNEHLINWDATIYVVEGAFDHIVTPNSIPLLGKYVHDKLFHLLQSKARGLIVIALDGDAYEDALIIYQKLNVLNLHGRIRVVQLREDLDLSLINEKYGRKGIIKVLSNSKEIPESRFL